MKSRAKALFCFAQKKDFLFFSIFDIMYAVEEEEAMEETMDRKSLLVMKLLHYFITDMNYNPVILQGAENEIWLENLDSDYKIVRIVSGYIHNEEQMAFDLFKTRKVMNKIKHKTFSWHMNVLSIYIDLGDAAKLHEVKNIDSIFIHDEKDFKKYPMVIEVFPDINKKLKFSEDGLQLFLKITDDINRKNKSDAQKVEEVFHPKKPIVTQILIVVQIAIFLWMTISGEFDFFINQFCVYGPFIRFGQYYRLITGTFLHGGILHLLFNMYALYIIGSQIESYMGKWKYLIIYFFSALMGSLFTMTFSDYASIGASGAIFGLMGSLLYFGYHYRVYLGNVLKSQLIPLIVLNLLLGFLDPTIDNFAHIGGLIGGILITLSLGVKYKSSNFEKINGWIVTGMFTLFVLYMAFIYA